MESNGSSSNGRGSNQDSKCELLNETGGKWTGTNVEPNQIFPCKSDEEVRAALDKLLHPVTIEVAGGIVRHHRSW